MPRTRRPYSAEFRQRLVDLVRRAESGGAGAQVRALRQRHSELGRANGARRGPPPGRPDHGREGGDPAPALRSTRAARGAGDPSKLSSTVSAVPPAARETGDASMLVRTPEAVAVSFMVTSRARCETWCGGGLRT